MLLNSTKKWRPGSPVDLLDLPEFLDSLQGKETAAEAAALAAVVTGADRTSYLHGAEPERVLQRRTPFLRRFRAFRRRASSEGLGEAESALVAVAADAIYRSVLAGLVRKALPRLFDAAYDCAKEMQ